MPARVYLARYRYSECEIGNRVTPHARADAVPVMVQGDLDLLILLYLILTIHFV